MLIIMKNIGTDAKAKNFKAMSTSLPFKNFLELYCLVPMRNLELNLQKSRLLAKKQKFSKERQIVI